MVELRSIGKGWTTKIKTESKARFKKKQRDSTYRGRGETKESAIERTPLFLQLAEPRVTARAMTFVPDYLLPWKILPSVPRLCLVQLAIKDTASHLLSVSLWYDLRIATTLGFHPLSSFIRGTPYLSFVPCRRGTLFAHVHPWEWNDSLRSSRKGQRRERKGKGTTRREGYRKEQRWSYHFFPPWFYTLFSSWQDTGTSLMSRILDFLFLQLVSGSFVLFPVDKYASVILVGKYRTPFELSPALLPRETFDSEYREQVETDLLPSTVRRGSVLIVPLTYHLLSIVWLKEFVLFVMFVLFGARIENIWQGRCWDCFPIRVGGLRRWLATVFYE